MPATALDPGTGLVVTDRQKGFSSFRASHSSRDIVANTARPGRGRACERGWQSASMARDRELLQVHIIGRHGRRVRRLLGTFGHIGEIALSAVVSALFRGGAPA